MAREMAPETGTFTYRDEVACDKPRRRPIPAKDAWGISLVFVGISIAVFHGMASPNPSVVPDGKQKLKRIDNPKTPDHLESRTAYAWCDTSDPGTLLVTDDQYTDPALIKKIPHYEGCGTETAPLITVPTSVVAEAIFGKTS